MVGAVPRLIPLSRDREARKHTCLSDEVCSLRSAVHTVPPNLVHGALPRCRRAAEKVAAIWRPVRCQGRGSTGHGGRRRCRRVAYRQARLQRQQLVEGRRRARALTRLHVQRVRLQRLAQ